MIRDLYHFMHQTFYIDIDEEISSVIDRLKKSMAIDNYFVAPKRAIFLQSIVNLKLLKREAEKMKKRVILVTQEEIVSAMAVRSGVEVRSSIEGLDEILDNELEDDDYEEDQADKSSTTIRQGSEKAVRLKNVGSDSFFDSQFQGDTHQRKKQIVPKRETGRISPDLANSNRVVNSASAQNNLVLKSSSRGNMGEIVAREKKQTKNFRNSTSEFYGEKNGLDLEKEKILEKMFLRKKQDASIGSRQIANVKTKNFFFIFIIVCLFLLAGVAGYLLIPSASINIKRDIQTVKIDTDANASQNQQGENAIPIHIIQRDEQLTLQYNATGKSSSAGKKAKGTVVVYNEFDSQSQTLVATTRLQADDGKVFRLLKTVVVPGMNNISGQSKPGAISVEIVADQPGAEYNIEATNFKIPGFKGGPKYEKFYAKSSTSFNGGTSEGDGVSGISQSDLESAKQKTETAMKEKIATIIKSEMGANEIDLPAAEQITMGKSFSNSKVGDGVGVFDYTVTASVNVLVFSEKEVKNIIEKTSQFKEQNQKNVTQIIKKIEYVSVEPNFENSTLALKIHSEVEVAPNVDTEAFKKEVLGKNESELSAILKKNPSIKNADVIFFPTFINRIPQFSQRVSVEVEKEQ